MPIALQFPENDGDDGDDDGDDDDDAIALQYNDRIQIRSILCVFSTDEPCKDRLNLTANYAKIPIYMPCFFLLKKIKVVLCCFFGVLYWSS